MFLLVSCCQLLSTSLVGFLLILRGYQVLKCFDRIINKWYSQFGIGMIIIIGIGYMENELH